MTDVALSYDLNSMFTSDGGTDCPLTSISLATDSKGTTSYSKDFVKIDIKNKLTIDPPSTAGTYEFYIIARSKGGLSKSIKVSLTYTQVEGEKQTVTVYSSLVNR